MKIKLTRESNDVKLYVNQEKSIKIEKVDSKLLEEFLEACLNGDADFEADKELEDHPITKLFNELYETRNPDNVFLLRLEA